MEEDQIIQDIKGTGAFYNHKDLAPELRRSFDKLIAYGIIEQTGQFTFRFTKEGYELARSGKTFERWTHPPFYVKFGRWILALLKPFIGWFIRGGI